VTCLLNSDTGSMAFMLNHEPLGPAFTGIDLQNGLVPVVSLEGLEASQARFFRASPAHVSSGTKPSKEIRAHPPGHRYVGEVTARIVSSSSAIPYVDAKSGDRAYHSGLMELVGRAFLKFDANSDDLLSVEEIRRYRTNA
jgi:hypothetical protein